MNHRQAIIRVISHAIIPALLIIGLSTLMLSCATSRGSAFSDAVEQEKKESRPDPGPAAPPQRPSQPSTPPPSGDPWQNKSPWTISMPAFPPLPEMIVINVQSDPEGAEVYLNGKYLGTTPLQLPEIKGSSFLLELRKDGWQPNSQLYYSSWKKNIHSTLMPITGTLRVQSAVLPQEIVMKNSSQAFFNGMAVQIGAHEARLRAFGYREQEASFLIEKDRTTTIRLDFQPRNFEVLQIAQSRTAINPEAQGSRASAAWNYSVSGPGTGEVLLRDGAGKNLGSWTLGPWTREHQVFTWPGTDPTGQALADGEYVLEWSLSGERGGQFNRSFRVKIDRTLSWEYFPMSNTSAGLAFCPAAETLSEDERQYSATMTAHFEDGILRAPLFLGTRFGFGSWEFDLGLGGVFREDSRLSQLHLASALKLRILKGFTVSASYVAKLTPDNTAATPSFDDRGFFPGLNVGLQGLVPIGKLSLLAAADLQVAPVPFFSSGAPLGDLAYAWVYLRGGAILNLDGLRLGASAAVRTNPFGHRLALFHDTLMAGAELHVNPKESPLFLSILAESYWRSLDSFYVSTGAGLGFRF